MKKYMNGNLVRYKRQVHRVKTSTSKYVTLEDIYEEALNEYEEPATYYKTLEEGEVEDIPLSDEFFINNDYKFNSKSELFIANDGFGPAIKKSELDYFCSDKVEYSVAGIVIRTVDEFQNLMNVIHCERIADKVIV